MENLITINLFGQTYTFKTESEMVRAKAVADLVVEEVDRVQERVAQQTGELPKLAVMILAALNLANENYDLRANRSELIHKMTEKSSRLMRMIESGCADVP
ncbi:MAG: cell division protein ZapA [Desulfobacterales bacterium]